MTALCTGGTSAPKAGWPALFDPTITLLAELLSARGGKWVIGALGFQLLDPISLSTFCAGDPPALPTFTADETNAILRLQFGADFDSGIGKLKDWLQHIIWYEVCECTSGTLATYTAPTIPAGTPEYYPPIPANATPCQTFTYTSAACDTGNVNKGGAAYLTSAVPTVMRCTLIGTQCGTVGAGVFNWVISQVGTGGADIATTTVQLTSPTQTVVKDILVAPGAISFRLNHNQLSGVSGQAVTGTTFDIYCGTDTPGVLSPCCPPDVATQAALDLILKMVTLIQRQSVPFAYVYGTNHTGLTGDGEISPVGGLIGLSVDVTTLPSSYGRASGTPERLFDLGFVTLGTTDGWLESRRIDADGSLVLPAARAGVFTRIGYTLAAGLEVAIRELVREP